MIALLVGLVAGYASSKPRIAFVDEDGIPPVVVVGGHRFHIQTVIDDVARSTSFQPYKPKEGDVPESLTEIYERCRECYEQLHKHRLN